MDTKFQLKRLTSDTFFYGLGSTLQKFIQLLLFPIYTRLLTQNDFGSLDLISTAFTIGFSLLIFGLDNGAARIYYDAETEEQKKRIISSWFWFGLLVSIPVCSLVIFYSETICIFLFGIKQLSYLFQISIITLPFAILSKIGLMNLRLHFKTKLFGLVTTLYILCQAITTILFVVSFNWGVQGVLFANLIANIFQFCLASAFSWKNIGFIFSSLKLSQMLAFGIPTIPASLAIWILNSSNRYFLARLAPLSEIGQLGVATRISTIATFLVSAFLTAWPMFAMSIYQDENLAKDTYKKTLTYFLTIGVGISVLLSVFAREAILFLATPDYLPAVTLIPFLCLGSIAWGAADIVGIGYTIAKKSYHITIATILGAGVNSLLNFLVIPRFGLVGAAVAILTGNLVILIYNYILGQKYYPVKYNNRMNGYIITLGISFIGFSTIIDHIQNQWNFRLLLVKLCVFLLFLFSLFVFKIISLNNILQLKNYIFSKVRRG